MISNRDGPQHDSRRSDTAIFSKNFSQLCQFGFIFHHFCFVLFLNTKLYVLVLAVSDFHYRA